MTLQEYIDAVRDGESVVTVELDKLEERAQALALRKAGLTYGAIATVMRVYHGSTMTEEGWRWACRRAGAAPKHYLNGNTRRLVKTAASS
jgi:hypothetical protein